MSHGFCCNDNKNTICFISAFLSTYCSHLKHITEHMHFIVKGKMPWNVYLVEILVIKYDTLDLWNNNNEEKKEKDNKNE